MKGRWVGGIAYVLLAPLIFADSKLQVLPGGLPLVGVVGVSYSGAVTAKTKDEPVRFSIGSGSLPKGLLLSSGGAVSGVPTAAGIFDFSIKATDRNGDTASRSFTIAIAPAPALSITTRSPLPGGAVGSPYSQTLAATGGAPPYRWSGSAPAGLSLSVDGLISGTPNFSGNFNFTVNVTDSASRTANAIFAVSIAPPPLIITTPSTLPRGAIGTPYSQTLEASGGSPPYRWSGSAPAGLTLSTSGTISGAPSAAGTLNFTATVSDGANSRVSRIFFITVDSATLTISTASLAEASIGVGYSQQLTATGGVPPMVWSIVGGQAPSGLSLGASNGVISGITNTPGSFSFTIQVRDSSGMTASKQFSIAVGEALSISSSPTLPVGAAGAPYSQRMVAGGGVPPYSWSINSGALPSGLALDAASGVISGAPTAAGSSTFALQVRDSRGTVASRQFTITISAPAQIPALSLASVPDVALATQQLAVDLSLADTYPLPITGQLTMTFTPDAVVQSDDPAVQFSTGGRSMNFTIPANSTRPASPIALQTGSVAGTIELQITAPGLPASSLNRSIRIARSAPVIRNLTVVRNATGFELRLVGLSTSRELREAIVRFAGTGLDTSEVRIPLTETAKTWYQSETSAQFGSQFALALPFTIQGSANAIQSATLTLSNAQGASETLTAVFGNP